jgi:uncharacterized protein (TIGR03083 family)
VERVIELLDAVWTALVDLGEGIEAGDPVVHGATSPWDLPTDCPGWSVRDQYAHMYGTESMLLGRAAPDVEIDADAPHLRNDLGRSNEHWVQSFRARPGREVLDAFRSVTAERLDVLRSMPPEEWDAETFTPEGPGPYRQFMEIRVFDCWFHEQDVREAIGKPGDVEGPVADAAVARIAKGMPYVVGKKAGAPPGSTVVFRVAGEHPFEVAVGVPERAVLLDAVPDDPTVRLTLDRRTYARLAGGRRPGSWALDGGLVGIDGDEDLGRRVVEHMGYMI